MHLAASIGVVMWIVGALLWFVVPGGPWSDVPGGALLALGFVIEALCTLAIVGRKLLTDD